MSEPEVQPTWEHRHGNQLARLGWPMFLDGFTGDRLETPQGRRSEMLIDADSGTPLPCGCPPYKTHVYKDGVELKHVKVVNTETRTAYVLDFDTNGRWDGWSRSTVSGVTTSCVHGAISD